jgi:hypothetical protein
MTIPKSLIAIILILLIGAAIIFFSKGCTPEPAVDTHVTDSLKWVIKTDSTQYAARYKNFEDVRIGLTSALRDTTAALQESRKQFTSQGKLILATNKRLRDAFNNHDSVAVYTDCDSLSHAIDSIAQVKWNVDRELDRQIVLNEQLHVADSVALADCRFTYKELQVINSLIQSTYDQELQGAQNDVKKAKRKNKLWGGIGVLIGGAIRSFIK